MTPINHYEGDRPKVTNHHILHPHRWPIIEQLNWKGGDIAFYGWLSKKDITPVYNGTTVAIFRIKYNAK